MSRSSRNAARIKYILAIPYSKATSPIVQNPHASGRVVGSRAALALSFSILACSESGIAAFVCYPEIGPLPSPKAYPRRCCFENPKCCRDTKRYRAGYSPQHLFRCSWKGKVPSSHMNSSKQKFRKTQEVFLRTIWVHRKPVVGDMLNQLVGRDHWHFHQRLDIECPARTVLIDEI